MAFSYSIQDNDFLASTPGGALLHSDLNQALAAWSQYIAGAGTLTVNLSVATLGSVASGFSDVIAEGGPTQTTSTGMTLNGQTVVQSGAATKLQTGASSGGSDISITYNALLIPTIGSSGDVVVTLEHELLHGFGINGFRNDTTGALTGTESTFDALTQVTAAGAFFVGGNAIRVYGGPVPLTSEVPGSNFYHVGVTGTSDDPAILYNDLISPYRHSGQAIDPLDIAILADLGIPITAAGRNLIIPPTLFAHSTSPDGSSVIDPTISGTTQAGRIVTLSENGAVLGTGIADPHGDWSIFPSGLSDGTHDLIASIQYGGGLVQYGVGIVLADGAAVQAIYNQLVGRNADPATLANLRQMLATGTPIAAIRVMVAFGVDASVAVGQLYAAVLGRWVDNPGLASALNIMAAGGTLAQVRAVVAGSPEAAADIAALYAGDLGRAATSVDITGWQAQLGAGSTLATLRSLLAGSAEEATAIAALYPAVLSRGANPGEVGNWQSLLAQAGTLAGVRGQIADSVESETDIGQTYAATLGRWVDNLGLSATLGFIAAGGSLAQVRANLAGSAEAAAAIAGVYAGDLGRAASSADVTGWQAQLSAGSTLGTLRSQLATSSEEAAAVSSLYPAAVGRLANPGEVANWQSLLAQGGTLAGIHVQLADSVESEIDIGQIYAATLGRWVDQLGLDYWVHRLENGGTQAMVRASVATSVEAGTAISKRYVADLGRPATAADISGWQSNLAGGATLDTLRGQLAASGEAASAISVHYNALLGRAPSTAELALAQSGLQSGGSLAMLDLSLIGGNVAGQARAIDATSALAHLPAPEAVELAADQSELASGVSLPTVEAQIAQLAGGPGPTPDIATSIQITPETIGSQLVYGLFDNAALLTPTPESVFVAFSGQPASILYAFNPATDILQVHASEFANFSVLQAHVSDQTPPAPPGSPLPSYVEIDAPDGAYIHINGVQASQLTASNFLFV